MNKPNRRKAVIGAIAATGLAAGMACQAQTQPDNNAAGVIIINGQPVNVAKIIQEIKGQLDDQSGKGFAGERIVVVKYGGPPSFNYLELTLSQEEIEFGIKEAIAETFKIEIVSVKPEMPIDLVREEGAWLTTINQVALKYHVEFSTILDTLKEIEDPTVADLMNIFTQEYMRRHKLQ